MGRHAHRTSRITSHSERVLPLEQEGFVCLKIVGKKNRIKHCSVLKRHSTTPPHVQIVRITRGKGRDREEGLEQRKHNLEGGQGESIW